MSQEVAVEDGRLLVNAARESLVAELGMTAVAQAFTPGFARLLRSLPDRDNGVVESSEGLLFLKRHQPRTRKLSPQGIVEWDNTRLLAEAGIPVAEPVCAGIDTEGRSFLLTVGIQGEPLDDFLRRGRPAESMMRELVDELALLSARLHAAGFCHRDYYLCHAFVQPARPAGDRLALIDLQRVMPLGRVRPLRWRLKDLAALGWSAIGLPVSDRERCRFVLCYSWAISALGVAGRQPGARVLLGAIQRRVEGLLQRHGPPQPPEPRDPELRWNPETTP